MFETQEVSAPQKRLDSLIGAGTTVHGDVTVHRRSAHRRSDPRQGRDGGQPAGHAGGQRAGAGGRRSPRFACGHQRRRMRAGDGERLPGTAGQGAGPTVMCCIGPLEMHVGAIVQGKLLHAEPESASDRRVEARDG